MLSYALYMFNQKFLNNSIVCKLHTVFVFSVINQP